MGMNIDKDVIDFHFHNVLNGFSPFLLEKKVFFGKHLSSKDIFEANAHCLKMRQVFKNEGIASEYDILNSCISNGIWSHDRDLEMKKLQESIKNKRKLQSLMFLPSDVKRLEAEIKGLIRKMDESQNEKQSLLVNSIEYKLLVEKRDYIAFLSIYKEDGTKLWLTYHDFAEESSKVSNQIISLHFKAVNEIGSDILRSIAKTTDARYRTKNAKFTNAFDISVNYLELSQWCDFYSSIYDLSDRPEEEIIQDDLKLDGWLASRKAKNQVDKSVNNNSGFTGVVGGNKEDMEILDGVDRNTVLKMSQMKNAEHGI